MSKQKQYRGPKTTNDLNQKRLSAVMQDIVSASDVNGAMIYRADGQVLSWLSNNELELGQYIDFARESIMERPGTFVENYKNGMFSQRIMEFNGSRVLMSRIQADVILLLSLDKNAYLGPTMLEMEGCIRQIDGILNICNT